MVAQWPSSPRVNRTAPSSRKVAAMSTGGSPPVPCQCSLVAPRQRPRSLSTDAEQFGNGSRVLRRTNHHDDVTGNETEVRARGSDHLLVSNDSDN